MFGNLHNTYAGTAANPFGGSAAPRQNIGELPGASRSKLPNTIFITNLSPQTTENNIRAHFASCGEIQDVRLIHALDGRSKGCAYVTFVSPDAARQAVALHETQLAGRNVRINYPDSRDLFGAPRGGNEGGFFGGSQNSLPAITIENVFNSSAPVKSVLDNLFAEVKDKTTETPTNKTKAQTMFEKLYTSKKFADVAFNVQGEEMLAHKALLAQESKYFEQIFSGSQQSEMMKIDIPDISPTTFKALLEYVYCDEMKPKEDLSIELLKLSEKYVMPDMKLKCEHTLGSLLTTTNFVKIAKVIEEYKTPVLRDELMSYTRKNGVDTIDKSALNEVPRPILIEMIEKLSERTAKSQNIFTKQPF